MMISKLKIAVAFLAVGIACAVHAAPARLPYQPAPAPKRPSVHVELRGTTWTGYNGGVKADWVVVFEADGSLTYTYNNRTYRNGTWKVEGNRLFYEVNKKYCECAGTIQGDLIQAESWNVRGLRWPIVLRRSVAAN